MKLGRCTASNFGSYEQLEFDFSRQGLALVHGATGSGKSTLQDLASWCLYGVTAKGGGVDDVRNWTNLESPTAATLEVDGLTITRTRGKGHNDLYWSEGGGPIRGKDIPDTQALLEHRLGVTEQLYLMGAYFHEFSLSGSFFTAKAAARREVFEGVANLALPIALAERAAAKRKERRLELVALQDKVTTTKGRIRQAETHIKQLHTSVVAWKRTHLATLDDLRRRAKNFDADLEAQLHELLLRADEITAMKPANRRADRDALKIRLAAWQSAHCPTCAAPTDYDARLEAQRELNALETACAQLTAAETLERRLARDIEATRTATNQHLIRYEEEAQRINPYSHQVDLGEAEQMRLGAALQTQEEAFAHAKAEQLALDTIADLAAKLRGELVRKAVSTIEEGTNKHLETYFDAEIRVTFQLKGTDNLEVSIFKSGHECSYRQLSKGQRGLLKLSFATTLMKVAAENSGVHFNALFLDEALDGLDVDLKIKAFGLLQELTLSHESVLVIDHSEEFKNLFDKRYHVQLVADASVIDES